jgi:hypothetical protein
VNPAGFVGFNGMFDSAHVDNPERCLPLSDSHTLREPLTRHHEISDEELRRRSLPRL